MPRKCPVCGIKRYLTRHHIVPRRIGGKTTPNNIYKLCRDCHDRVEAYIKHREKALYRNLFQDFLKENQ